MQPVASCCFQLLRCFSFLFENITLPLHPELAGEGFRRVVCAGSVPLKIKAPPSEREIKAAQIINE